MLRFVRRCAAIGDRLEPGELVLDRSAAGFAVARDQPSARVQRRGHSWQRAGHGRCGMNGAGGVDHVLFADRHPVSNVTGGDDMAGQAGGAVEDVDSQDM
jgi:hypothetical protein